MDRDPHQSATITLGDILAGARYAMAFDKSGWSISAERRVKKCRRLMTRIVNSMGRRQPPAGVVTLSLAARALEAQSEAMADVVIANCAACPYRSRNECKGIGKPSSA
jgi:hypothetical protein